MSKKKYIKRKTYVFIQLLLSCQVMSNCLQPHGLQHAKLLCPPPISSPHVHELVISSNHLILCCPLFSCPQYFPESRFFQMSQLFPSGGQKYWSFSFSISPSNLYSGLISFRIDWFDLLVVQGTLKSLPQHNSKTSILGCSTLFMVQFLHV